MSCCFCTKTQNSFILNYRGNGEEMCMYVGVWGGGGGGGGLKGI